MSSYTDIAIPYWQLTDKEIRRINNRIQNGEWNWEEQLTRKGMYWQASFRNFTRRPRGHDKQGVEKLVDIIKDEIEHEPHIPTKLQIFTQRIQHAIASRPEVKQHRYDWNND